MASMGWLLWLQKRNVIVWKSVRKQNYYSWHFEYMGSCPSMSFLAAKRMQGEGAFIVKAIQEVRTVAQVCSRFWETSVVNNPDVLWSK